MKWWPIRLGIWTRGKLLDFAMSYGSTFIWVRRPMAVFIDNLLLGALE